MHLIASVQWVSPHCFVLTHSIILRASLDRKGEQICNMKLWKRILKNGLLRYWLDSMKSQWCFYTWTLYPKEYLVFRIILALALHLIFFFLRSALQWNPTGFISGSNSHHPSQQHYFFRIHFEAWHEKYSFPNQQELQDHACLLSKSLSVITALPFTHNTSEQMSSQWCLRKIPHVPKSYLFTWALHQMGQKNTINLISSTLNFSFTNLLPA